METQPNSDKNLDGSKNKLQAAPEDLNEASSKKKKEAIGTHYHDFMPRHSTHGRLNIRGIGPDHEPGTMR